MLPKADALTASIAASRLSTGDTLSTGPKISVVATSLFDLRQFEDGRTQEVPLLVARDLRLPPVHEHLRPFRDAALDEARRCAAGSRP